MSVKITIKICVFYMKLITSESVIHLLLPHINIFWKCNCSFMSVKMNIQCINDADALNFRSKFHNKMKQKKLGITV